MQHIDEANCDVVDSRIRPVVQSKFIVQATATQEVLQGFQTRADPLGGRHGGTVVYLLCLGAQNSLLAALLRVISM
jgi:hypothetical protein